MSHLLRADCGPHTGEDACVPPSVSRDPLLLLLLLVLVSVGGEEAKGSQKSISINFLAARGVTPLFVTRYEPRTRPSRDIVSRKDSRRLNSRHPLDTVEISFLSLSALSLCLFLLRVCFFGGRKRRGCLRERVVFQGRFLTYFSYSLFSGFLFIR